jgi:hypothetical protein
MTAILTRLLDVLGFAPLPEPPVIAPQSDWYDASRRRIADMHASDAAVAKEHYRVAQLVGAWATQTVLHRHRATFPRVVGRDGSAIALWLPGLNTAEIMKIAAAPTTDIDAHLFTENLILGVRKVQPLPEAILFWPRPKLNADDKNGRR